MSLLDQFFAPITKGSGGSGAAGNASAGVDVSRLDYSIPGPFGDDDSDTAEDLWDTVWLGDIPLPPVGTGHAELVCPPKITPDKKKGVGAKKPKVTIVGGEGIDGTITVKFVQEALPAMAAACKTLYPGGGTFPIKHPKATLAQLKNVQITSWGDAPDPDAYGLFTWVIHFHEVSPPAQAGTGKSGVKTSKTLWVNAKPGDPAGAEAHAAIAAEKAGSADGVAQQEKKKKDATAGATP